MFDMDKMWITPVDQTGRMSVKESQLATIQRTALILNEKVNHQENLLREREHEVNVLRKTVEELKLNLDAAANERKRIVQDAERTLQETTNRYCQELQRQTMLIEEMKTRHKEAVLSLVAGARDTLQDVESQLEATRSNEAILSMKISELEEAKGVNERQLQKFYGISEKMNEELLYVKKKLQSTRFANTKLREESALWKKYSEKTEEERQAVIRNTELENICLFKLNEIMVFIESERQQKNYVLEKINKLESTVTKDLRSLDKSEKSTPTLASVECQTEGIDALENGEEKDVVIDLLKKREKQLVDDLKNFETAMNNLTQQNLTLRDVVKSMKTTREIQEKEDQIRVTKLENCVKELKNKIYNDKNDLCLWTALRDVKKEVSNLKYQNKQAVVFRTNESAKGSGSAEFVIKQVG